MKHWPHLKQGRLPKSSAFGKGTTPKLSIITPSYNQGRFLEETILSVLNQNYPNLEYIIVDGGSTDNSVEIIKKYQSHLAYWVSEKDQGQAHAINKGLSRATGDVLSWLNSDDIYLPWTFRNAMKYLDEHPKIAMVSGGRILIDENTDVIGFGFPGPYNPRYGYTIAQETTFWRRDVQEAVGPLDEKFHFAMDYDFFSRIYLKYPIGVIPKLQGCFRCYADNKSTTMQQVREADAAIIDARHFGGNPLGRWADLRADRHYSQLRVALYPSLVLLPMVRRRLRRAGLI